MNNASKYAGSLRIKVINPFQYKNHWDSQRAEKREAEAKQLYIAEVPQLVNRVVTVNKPIQAQANISTDGGMVLLREEGWKRKNAQAMLAALSEFHSGRFQIAKQFGLPVSTWFHIFDTFALHPQIIWSIASALNGV